MDLGHISHGASRRDTFVGDAGAFEIEESPGLVHVWVAVRRCAADKSRARRIAAFSAWVGGLGRLPRWRGAQVCVEASRSGNLRCSLMLRAVDDSKLRCFSQAHPVAFESAVRTLA